MAYLLSLIVNGVTRLQNDTHGTNIYADKHIKNNSNDNYILLGGGGHIDKGTFALANHGVHWEGFTKRATSSATWGTLISSNGYTPLFWLDSTSGGGVAFSDKGGQTFMQIDGYFYQNEGRYRLTDVTETVTALSTSGNYLTWTKNGTTNNITVPYASKATLDGNGNTISSYYLPLSGGTLTGPVEIKSTSSGNFNEGLRISVAPNDWAGITFGSSGLSGAPTNGWFAALNPSDQFIITPNSSSNTTGLTLNAGGDAKWRNNTLLHTGNYSSTLDGRYYTETEVNNLLAKYLPLAGGTMTLGEGLKFHSDENYFGTNLDARIISLLDGNGTTCDGGLIIDERATSSGTEHITELLRIRDAEFKWKGNTIWHAGNDGSGSGLDADKVDGYHASSLWRSDGATWNPTANITMTPTSNGQEWSFDFRSKGSHTGSYWHVWDESKSTLLRVDADSGAVSAPYGFVGNLTGNASSASTVTVNNSDTNSTYRMVWHSGNTLYSTAGIYCNPNLDSIYASFMELSRTTDHGLKVGSIRGTAVGSRTGHYIHMYERVHIGSPNGWGSNDAPTQGLSTYGGAWLAVADGSVGIGTAAPVAKLHINAKEKGAPLILSGGKSGYTEGLRIIPSSSAQGVWSVILLGGSDVATASGTSAKSWFIGNHDGKFYINKNASDTVTGSVLCNVDGNWGIGNVQPSYKLSITGSLFSDGGQTFKGMTSIANKGNNASYAQAAVQIREYNFGGSQTDTWGNAPRLAWHWSGRVQAQIGLASDNHLYISEDGSFSTPHLILHSGNSYVTNGVGVIGNTTITKVSNADYAAYSGYTLSLDSVGLPSSTSNAANTVWCKFATITFNASGWCNTAGYIFFSGGESSDYKGILEYHFRASQSATEISLGQLSWISKSHAHASVIAVKSANNVYDFYTNNCSTWSTPRIYHFSAFNNRFRWNVGSWTTTKPGAAYTASDVGRVYYSTNAGNADTVDSQHFTYSNSSNSPTYLWATNSNGSSFLAARGSISVNYANSAGSAATLSGGSIATWGTLTAANGYTNVCTWDTGNTTGAFSLAGKGGQMSLQLDGFFYQNEGKYLVLDTNNYSSTLDGRYVNVTGDKMTGTLTVKTNGTGSYDQGIRINRVGTSNWALLMIGKSGDATSGTGTGTAGDGAWLIGTPASSNSLIFNLNTAAETVGLCLKGHGNTDMKWNNNTVWHAGNDGSGSGLDADKVDGYHASSLWRSDGGVWNPSANISLGASANSQEWSFDITRNGHTGCYWHVWDSQLGTMLRVNADDGKVSAQYGFVGNLSGTASSVTVNSSDSNSTYRMVWHSGNNLYGTGGIYCNPSSDTLYATYYRSSGTIRVTSANSYGNFCEGLRLHAPDSTWATIIMGCTADTGTNTYAWSIHRKSDNNFCISRGSSDGANGLLINTSGNMGLGNITPYYKLTVNGTAYATKIIASGESGSSALSETWLQTNSLIYTAVDIARTSSSGGWGVTVRGLDEVESTSVSHTSNGGFRYVSRLDSDTSTGESGFYASAYGVNSKGGYFYCYRGTGLYASGEDLRYARKKPNYAFHCGGGAHIENLKLGCSTAVSSSNIFADGGLYAIGIDTSNSAGTTTLDSSAYFENGQIVFLPKKGTGNRTFKAGSGTTFCCCWDGGSRSTSSFTTGSRSYVMIYYSTIWYVMRFT